MIVPPKPRRRLKSPKTESVCIIDEIVLCMHFFFFLVIQNNKNGKKKKILVNTTNPIQIREQGIPKKKMDYWIMQERDCPFHETHCKPVSTMPIS